jgi:hypothetical protein
MITWEGAKLYGYCLLCGTTASIISVWVVRLWCGICTDPVLRCVNNPEGLNCRDQLEDVIPELGELANGLRLNTEVPSQDLSGAWVTIRWVRASQGTCLSIGSDGC